MCRTCAQFEGQPPSEQAPSDECECCRYSYDDPAYVKVASNQCGDEYYLCMNCHFQNERCPRHDWVMETQRSANRFK